MSSDSAQINRRIDHQTRTLAFDDDNIARLYFEELRWPDGPCCTKCGHSRYYETSKQGRYRCASPSCRRDFTVFTGSVLESSHVRPAMWLTAFYLMASRKNGVSAHEIHRTIEVTYKTAWSMRKRIRAAMLEAGLDIAK